MRQNNLSEVFTTGVLERFGEVGREAVEVELFSETWVPGLVEGFVVKAINNFRFFEVRIFVEDELDVQRHDAGKPAVAVNDVRLPSEFFDGFKYAAAKEHSAFVVVWVVGAVFFLQTCFAFEVVVVVDEVDLHSSCRNRGNFDE